jgi:hypothetical protein
VIFSGTLSQKKKKKKWKLKNFSLMELHLLSGERTEPLSGS